MSIESAAMLEPFALRCTRRPRAPVSPGAMFFVSGFADRIGLMAIGAARALGASRVVATDVNPLRLRAPSVRCRSVGETSSKKTLRPRPATSRTARAFDVVLECGGQEAGAPERAAALAPGGELRLIGVPSEAGFRSTSRAGF